MQIERDVKDEVWRVGGGLRILMQADGVGDFLDAVGSGKGAANPSLFRDMKGYAAGHDMAWAGPGIKVIEGWLAEGQVETLAKVEQIKDRLANETGASFSQPAPKRRRVRGLDCGEEADLDRFARRDLNCWEEMRREPMPRRMVTIGMPLILSGSMGWEGACTRGASVIALADWLTAQGYAVRILGFALFGKIAADHTGGWALQTVELKAANAPLDLAAVTTAACEPAFFRCAMMPALVGEAHFKITSGVGFCSDPNEEQRRSLGIDLVPPERIAYGPQHAAKWLDETVAAIRSGDLLNPAGGVRETGETRE
jgi:hypothetical protein